MDDDEREFGDADTRAEDYEYRLRMRRAMWTPTASDPYPDWRDEPEPEPEPEDEQEDEAEDE